MSDELAQLRAEVERLRRELQTAEQDALTRVAVGLAARRSALGPEGRCPSCRDREARLVVAQLHEMLGVAKGRQP
jgi:hypothetical protein